MEGETKAADQREFFRSTCGKCGARRVDRQLGLEETPQEYVRRVVEIFREVRRVLRRDGTLWLNLGDSYGGSRSGPQGEDGEVNDRTVAAQRCRERGEDNGWRRGGLKQKDLAGIPWRVAFALQDDGWYLRSEIIWAKPNPMPESVTDRPTKAHEQIFLLTKAPRYFYDGDAIRTEHAPKSLSHRGGGRAAGLRSSQDANGAVASGNLGTWAVGKVREPDPRGANARSVWEIPTTPYPEAHFATFPPALPERCIRAGTSERGCCGECGAPWARVVNRQRLFDGEPVENAPAWAKPEDPRRLPADGNGHWRWETRSETVGWNPTCSCDAPVVPCVVLDPFAGSGTTGAVARQLGRRFIGLDLSFPYLAQLARNRIGVADPYTAAERPRRLRTVEGPLFEERPAP